MVWYNCFTNRNVYHSYYGFQLNFSIAKNRLECPTWKKIWPGALPLDPAAPPDPCRSLLAELWTINVTACFALRLNFIFNLATPSVRKITLYSHATKCLKIAQNEPKFSKIFRGLYPWTPAIARSARYAHLRNSQMKFFFLTWEKIFFRGMAHPPPPQIRF